MSEVAVKSASILGGGAFGMAIACVLGRKNANVMVYERAESDPMTVCAHAVSVKGVNVPRSIQYTSKVSVALQDAKPELILIAIGVQFIRGFVKENLKLFPLGVPIVLCSKGIDEKSLSTPWHILEQELPKQYHPYFCALSGPSFAKEVAQGLETSVTIASFNEALAQQVQKQMACRAGNFRTYTTDDVMGVEIAGAVKNVLAIASGMVKGSGGRENARAALISRGLAEMMLLASALGSNTKALSGLAGLGDLSLTCSSELSRNFSMGVHLSQGKSIPEAAKLIGGVAEGHPTARALQKLCQKMNIHMPICNAVYQILYEGKPVNAAFQSLSERPLTPEFANVRSKL